MREIRIPGPLRLIHGETADAFDVLLVYVVGVVFGVLALVFASTRVEALPLWKAVLLFVLAADVSGGAMACFSAGMHAYYESRPGLRWAFIFIHFIEPGLLYLLFDGRLAYWLFLYAFTVAVRVPGQHHPRTGAPAGRRNGPCRHRHRDPPSHRAFHAVSRLVRARLHAEADPRLRRATHGAPGSGWRTSSTRKCLPRSGCWTGGSRGR